MAFSIRKLRRKNLDGYTLIEVKHLGTGEIMISDVVTIRCECRIDAQTKNGLKLFGTNKGLKAENCSGINITEKK